MTSFKTFWHMLVTEWQIPFLPFHYGIIVGRWFFSK